MSVWSDGLQGNARGILPSPTAIDQLFIMSREYGIGAGVVRYTFYMSASLLKHSSPERKKENRAGVVATNFRLWTCSNHTSSFGNLRESHHISLCIRGGWTIKDLQVIGVERPPPISLQW